MIIRTANLELIVSDATSALNALTSAAESKGGYVTESKQWREGEQVRATVTLRIPSEHLNATIAAARRLAIRVEIETVSGQDVTAEFSDLGAQLRNLEATEVELRQLLSTVRQRSQKAADILEVYNELTKVRGEIERIKGRMKYLSDLTSFSTIHVALIPDAIAKPVVEPGWRPLGIVKEASRSLISALKWMAGAAIWLVLFVLPLMLILLLPILGIRWLIRRRRNADSV